MAPDPTWTARFAAGPLDGATVDFDVADHDLPGAVVMSFGVREQSSELVWHSYVLDRSQSVFSYLGQNRITDAPSDGPDEEAVGDDLTRRFYELLFERHPSLRSMFRVDMRRQAAMLRRAMKGVLDHLGDPDWLVDTLGALGARHAALGVSPSMYTAFVECMLTAMAEAAGTEWTPELERGWRDTLDDIIEVMVAGSGSSP